MLKKRFREGQISEFWTGKVLSSVYLCHVPLVGTYDDVADAAVCGEGAPTRAVRVLQHDAVHRHLRTQSMCGN